MSGVPQGGVLSPEEFNMYVSDIPEILKCNNFEFADDLVILSIVKNTKDIDILQKDLLNLENYCNENIVACNSPKCSRPCCVSNMLEILQNCQRLFMTEHIPLFISLETIFSFINEFQEKIMTQETYSH